MTSCGVRGADRSDGHRDRRDHQDADHRDRRDHQDADHQDRHRDHRDADQSRGERRGRRGVGRRDHQDADHRDPGGNRRDHQDADRDDYRRGRDGNRVHQRDHDHRAAAESDDRTATTDAAGAAAESDDRTATTDVLGARLRDDLPETGQRVPTDERPLRAGSTAAWPDAEWRRSDRWVDHWRSHVTHRQVPAAVRSASRALRVQGPRCLQQAPVRVPRQPGRLPQRERVHQPARRDLHRPSLRRPSLPAPSLRRPSLPVLHRCRRRRPPSWRQPSLPAPSSWWPALPLARADRSCPRTCGLGLPGRPRLLTASTLRRWPAG